MVALIKVLYVRVLGAAVTSVCAAPPQCAGAPGAVEPRKAVVAVERDDAVAEDGTDAADIKEFKIRHLHRRRVTLMPPNAVVGRDVLDR